EIRRLYELGREFFLIHAINRHRIPFLGDPDTTKSAEIHGSVGRTLVRADVDVAYIVFLEGANPLFWATLIDSTYVFDALEIIGFIAVAEFVIPAHDRRNPGETRRRIHPVIGRQGVLAVAVTPRRGDDVRLALAGVEPRDRTRFVGMGARNERQRIERRVVDTSDTRLARDVVGESKHAIQRRRDDHHREERTAGDLPPSRHRSTCIPHTRRTRESHIREPRPDRTRRNAEQYPDLRVGFEDRVESARPGVA